MSKCSTSIQPSTDHWGHLNETETADLLNLSKRTLQGWRGKGEGPKYEKFGRSVRYSAAAIKAWIEECERTSTSASGPPCPWGIPNPNVHPELRKGERS